MTFVVGTYSLGLVGRASTGDGCPSCNTAIPTKACLDRIIEIVHNQVFWVVTAVTNLFGIKPAQSGQEVATYPQFLIVSRMLLERPAPRATVSTRKRTETYGVIRVRYWSRPSASGGSTGQKGAHAINPGAACKWSWTRFIFRLGKASKFVFSLSLRTACVVVSRMANWFEPPPAGLIGTATCD